MAKKFNTYFLSVFTVENLPSLPTADKIFYNAESEKLQDILFDEAVLSVSSFFLTIAAVVRKKLEKLRSDKASGVDVLSVRILTELKDEIYRPLTVTACN